MMRSRLAACFIVFLAFAAVEGQPVAAHPLQAPSVPVPELHWTQFPVHVFVEAKTAEEVQKALVALAGLDEWVDASHGKVCYVRTLDPRSAEITVRFQPGKFLSADTKVIGETEVTWSGTTLRKASIRLAEGVGTLEDLQADAAHEFGHALGIQQHSADPNDLMFPVEVVHFSALGDPLPETSPTVTAHDMGQLAACYPQLFPAPSAPGAAGKP